MERDADKPVDAQALRDVVLAEYSALRAEIVGRISAQDTMVNLHLTAVAAIIGFAVAERGSLGLLLLVPPLSCTVSALYVSHNAYIRLMSRYIRSELRLSLEQALGSTAHFRIFAWEDWTHVSTRARRLHFAHRGTMLAVFPLPAALAILIAAPTAAHGWLRAVWWVDLFLVLVEVVIVTRPTWPPRPTRYFPKMRSRDEDANSDGVG